MDENIQTLKEWIDGSDNIVFFGGAGVSTESGIKDFRSVDGLYHEKYDYPPETILSHTFFMRKTEDFYKFYRDKLLLEGIKPNKAHERLALLEQRGKLKAVITQNIDGLHQMAGSKEVMELHGSVLRNYCMKCGKFHDVEDIKGQSGVPKCECGGIIKPDVVLYEEGLDNMTITKSIQYISNADVLIIGGTSLVVYPAAGLIDYYRGKKLVLINMQPTPQDDRADLVIRGKIGEIMSQVVEE
ncbi:MAG: NAD-dependent protein deacylase [Lachnospiraceae bacterium]|nr:NAD-dependent protein deacylase [Lachnospiraceae bacterium]